MIKLQQIKKSYQMGGQPLQVLHGIDLNVKAGEMIAITGSSGGGKSTLMNILGCLDRPSEGSYYLDGHDVSNLSDNELAGIRNRKIGFVFQSFHLLSKNTALDNVKVPMMYAGIENGEARAKEALTRVGLGDRMCHLPSQMSGGQRQRVAIARAMVMNPPILLADEPTGNLDTKTGDEIMALFENLHTSGTTIILVTHEPEIAAYAERNIHLRDGNIEFDKRKAAGAEQ
ncbi:MAG: ABC transporter ATP-binding protein [Deltaproteobacteria bacterium]|nr:MAG: ABC transporter ATP-binding protein [Deltaproteobacteria bacterium]